MKTLKINLLYRCTAKCSHCRFFCENESEVVTPDFETPYAVAKGLKENFGLDMAVILGGEPTLFRDETIQLIQRIHALVYAQGWKQMPGGRSPMKKRWILYQP